MPSLADPRRSLPDTADLRVVDARTHNLKGVSCAIPHGKVTVVTGPSGAGKSSLVFDTLFAEGQRRFVESMSTYVQQFIQQLERPPVEAIENVLPAVALEARNSVKNARSTVGTLTETHDLLRLLFTYCGIVHCPEGHGEIRRHTRDELVDALVAGAAGATFVLTAPVVRPKRAADDSLGELIRQGFFRVWLDGELVRLEPGAGWEKAWDPLEIVLGRYGAEDGSRERIRQALDEAFRLRDDLAYARPAEGGEPRFLSTELRCLECGTSVRRPVPPLFSFNSPLGACSTCSGFGRVLGIDPDLVIPDRAKSLEERPIAPWNSKSRRRLYTRLFKACRERGVPLDVPWEELPEEDRSWIWAGGRGFKGIQPFFDRLERKKYRVHVRVLLSRYRSYDLCPECRGARLQPDALAVTIGGETLPELTARSVEAMREWLRERTWTEAERAKASHVLELLEGRLETLHRVGLDYLTLDRQARTLSGGESQRIHLATALGSGLTGTLYALDEPTIGLHPRDSRMLLGLLDELAERGNTVVVVEHEPVVIRGADHVIELGPGAGEHGGEKVFEGPLDAMLAADTLTARFLGNGTAVMARRHASRRRKETGGPDLAAALRKRPGIEIRGASEHNLRGLDVTIPREALVAVTGVSGSGKSTLVGDVLFEGYRRHAGEAGAEPGRCESIGGFERFREVLFVDQNPLGRSSRSNPVSLVGAYDALRKLYSRAPEAEARKLTPGHFSFNVDKGRCPACKGTGEEEVDLQFLGTLTVLCERCRGRRFRPEVLAVRVHGLSIDQALDLTVREAIETFDYRPFTRRLEVLETVGLEYLRLGQPTSTLSAGEAQRLKLAEFLRTRRKKGDAGRLLLFDEPTTGLHLSDIARLYKAFRALVAKGDTVVVVEHQMDLVARCDWIVDLGPGGGRHGGELLFCGPVEELLASGVESPTREELAAGGGARPSARGTSTTGC